ncbi:MAG: WGR domain-containing protein [Myxococcota bacterium]|nr:WGR domain-containing protein [Deltaproteobacteria bacterium]MDQ3340039.1 WGR domain-containing protein [Myxococcota bacterium]
MPRYEFQEGSSSKFWEINLLGKSFTTKFGKIGSNGQTKLKEHSTDAAAKAEYDKLIAEKTKKGYKPAGGGKPNGEAAKANGKVAGQYFENGKRFYELTASENGYSIRSGKIGTDGETESKVFNSTADASSSYAMDVRRITNERFALVRGKAPKLAVTANAANKELAKPRPKPAKAAKAGGGNQYFEFKEGSSSKFWEIKLEDKSHTVRFGKIGTDGQSSQKSFKSAGEARADHDKLVAEKTKKGYQLVRGEAPAGPTITHARDEKLEAAIASDPDNADAYLVYADWLQGQGDPRGELIVLQHANKAPAVKKLLQQNKQHFFGKLADAQAMLEPYDSKPLGKPTTWRWGYLESLWISAKYDYDNNDDGEDLEVEDALAALLDHPSCRFLRELTVGITSTEGGNGYAATAKVLGKRSLPLLRKLVLGDFISEETELNWSDMGNLEPMYKAMPNLESLTLRSGSMKLGKLVLPKLKELFIISGGLDKKSLASITEQKWPHLETLNVQVGEEGSPEIKLKDLAPIFAGTNFPKVKHLGLGNAPFQDEIAQKLAELATSKIAAQIETLDLSQGTLGDAGAAALVTGKFPKLTSINVKESWLSKKGIAALKTIAKNVDAGDKYSQQDDEGDPENRYISGRE